MSTTTARKPARPLTKKQREHIARVDAAEPAEGTADNGSMAGGGPEPETQPVKPAETPEQDAPAPEHPEPAAEPQTPAPEPETRVVPAGALTVRGEQHDWTPAQRAALEAMSFKRDKPGHAELQVFLTYSQRTGLDPFARQIYMIARRDGQGGGVNWTIQTSIDGARVVAQRSGEYAGQTPPQWCGPDGKWVDVWLSNDMPSAARVGVHRRGFAEPLYAVARWGSYYPGDGNKGMMWRKMPDVMLSKVAEMLALRKAFPQDLAGLYTAEEMDQADVVQGSVVQPAQPRQEEPPAPVDPAAVQAGLRAAMQHAAGGDRKALEALWRELKPSGVLAALVEFGGGSGTLGDLIVWLGTNDSADQATDWLDEHPEQAAEQPADSSADVPATPGPHPHTAPTPATPCEVCGLPAGDPAAQHEADYSIVTGEVVEESGVQA